MSDVLSDAPRRGWMGSPGAEASPLRGAARWVAPALLLAGLAAIVAGRWLATRAGLDPLVVGTGFGLALVLLVVIAGRAMPAAPAERRASLVGRAIRLALGAAFGLALVAIVLAGANLTGATIVPGLARPAAPWLPWAAVTILVASAQEVLLRGRLFDAIRRAGGIAPAVLITTVAFALMHVPLYGWHVVPLDLAVGLAFAGLRLASGGVIAPAAAHAVADLATWWL